MISAIVAADENFGIGFQGKLLMSIPEDLKYFKELTSGHIVVMGSKTWDSLPIKPLPNRLNVIVTRNPSLVENKFPNVWYGTIGDVIEKVFTEKEEIFIIGGGVIYEKLLSFCDRVYLTKIYKSFDNVDTYFPNLDEMPDWEMEEVLSDGEENGITFQICLYRKKR